MKNALFSLILCLSAIASFAQNSVMDFYNAKVKEMQAAISDASRKPIIKIKDEKNGFIAYDLNSTAVMGFEEMAYFVSDNGKKFVATITFGCGPLCSCGFPIFFELKNCKLIDQTEKYFPITVGTQAEAYVLEREPQILAQIKADYKKKNGVELAEDAFLPLTMWIKLPQKGTTIQIGMMEGAEENGTFHLIAELQYNVANGTFKLIKK